MADIFTGRGSPRFPSFPKPEFGRPVSARPSFSPRRTDEPGFGTRLDTGQRPGPTSFGDEQGFGSRLDTGAIDLNRFDQAARAKIFTDPGGAALAFETKIASSGLPQNMVDFFRKNAGKFLADFQGELGRQISLFGKSDLNPLEFFNDLNLRQEFQRISPSERDPNVGQFNRANRFLF